MLNVTEHILVSTVMNLGSQEQNNAIYFKPSSLVYLKEHKPKEFVHSFIHSFIHSQALIVQDKPLASLSRFLDHTYKDTRRDFSGRVISPPQRPLPTQDNTTIYKHNRQTSMPLAGFDPVTPNNQAAADLRLRPRGHWESSRLSFYLPTQLSPTKLRDVNRYEISYRY
jgi:hypothetical protein